jgi:serine/threonine protein kinase/tetratricopeptide (TPR) repeat protein
MGEVYAAYDPELDRKVALKVLRANASAGVDRGEAQSRILREAQALAQLADPNVVAVYDVGTYRERVFIAMEFVDGTTLSFWRQARKRSWREVVEVYVAAGRGLAAAHRRGLVHRDFKPENVMLRHDGQVRVMDFGLARSERQPVPSPSLVGLAPARMPPEPQEVDWDTVTRNLTPPTAPPPAVEASPSALLSPLTQVGAMMGTPAYMAPEQFAGAVADAKSDQFSFCVAFYEALYDERPFAGKNLGELEAHVAAGRVRPAPPQARVPGWLRKVLLQGLRASRDERHASMEALLSSLERGPRRRRRLATAAGVSLIVALLGVGFGQSVRHQQRQCSGGAERLAGIWEPPARGQTASELTPRKEGIRLAFTRTGRRYAAEAFTLVQGALDRYVTAWTDMHRDACEATHVRGEQSSEVLDLRMLCLQDRLNEVRALTSVLADANRDVVGKSIEAAQSLRPIQGCADIAALRAVVRPPEDPVLRATVANLRASLAEVKARREAGKWSDAARALDVVIDQARGTGYGPVIAEALLESGQLATLQGDSATSERRWEEATWAAEAAGDDEVALFSTAELVYAAGYERGRIEDAERWAHFADAILTRLGGGHEQAAGWLANNRALVYEREGKLDRALASALDAVALKTRAFGHEHFDVAISEGNVGEILRLLGRFDEALARNDVALSILRATVVPDHALVAFALRDRAEILMAKGRYEEGKAAAEKALEISSHGLGSEHPMVTFARVSLAESLLGLGRAGEAVKLLEQAVPSAEAYARDPSLTGQAKYALARALTSGHRMTPRARGLALEAAASFRKNPAEARKADEVEAWAAAAGRPGPGSQPSP